MPIDYTAKPPNHVRRQDRAIDDEDWIRQLLHRADWGTLATVSDGQPFINTNLFAYDEANHCLYMHTHYTGRTVSNVQQHERVCFSVAEMGRLLPASEAVEFSVEYSGVVVFGRGEVLADEEAKRHGLELLMAKYFGHLQPGVDYEPINSDEMKRTGVHCIYIENWSGKQKRAADDFPGAFRYGEAVG